MDGHGEGVEKWSVLDNVTRGPVEFAAGLAVGYESKWHCVMSVVITQASVMQKGVNRHECGGGGRWEPP